MSQSELPPSNSSLGLDEQIKQAQRSGASAYLMLGGVTLVILSAFFLWLFVVKGYNVIANPMEARETLNIEFNEGFGFVSDNSIYVFGSNAKLLVDADRFQTSQLNIDEKTPNNIEIQLKPVPAQIRSNLNELSGETAWYVDGQMVFVGNNFSHQLSPGDYSLTLDNPYYKIYEVPLSLERGQTIELVPTLIPLQGTMSIDSVPQGAEVSIGVQSVGKTPLKLQEVAGSYPVTLSLDGYEDTIDTIEIRRNGLQPERQYKLAPKLATLTVRAEPTGGLLLVNGQEMLPGNLKLDANRTHRIRYSLDGYERFERSISLSLSEPTKIDIKLKPVFGKVNFEASKEAFVFIDNQFVGKTPVTLNLKSIKTQAEFKREGYRTQVKTFTPNAKQDKTVRVTMLTEFDARRAEGRPLFVSQLGIQMAPFRPNAFTMGSAPNEAGRKRDEHQVKVDFDRAIWVSRHEISEAQFSAFDPSKPTSNLPVVNISWLETAQYANWLSENEGLPAFYQIRNGRLLGYNTKSNGYRLLTEAEWEWLARKAKRAAETKYVWGNRETLPKQAGNFADEAAKNASQFYLQKYNDGYASRAPIGSFEADRAGLYDLAGNVKEWVNDYYTNVTPDLENVQQNYFGAKNGQQFIVKGASYRSGRLRELRASAKTIGEGPAEDVGFRIARFDKALEQN